MASLLSYVYNIPVLVFEKTGAGLLFKGGYKLINFSHKTVRSFCLWRRNVCYLRLFKAYFCSYAEKKVLSIFFYCVYYCLNNMMTLEYSKVKRETVQQISWHSNAGKSPQIIRNRKCLSSPAHSLTRGFPNLCLICITVDYHIRQQAGFCFIGKKPSAQKDANCLKDAPKVLV